MTPFHHILLKLTFTLSGPQLGLVHNERKPQGLGQIVKQALLLLQK